MPFFRPCAVLACLSVLATWPLAAQTAVKPSIIATDGITLHGIADPAAKVFICASAAKPTAPPPDCSATAAKFTAAPTPPSVTINPDTQQFAVTLTPALAANSWVYLEQIPAGGAAAAAVFSQPVTVSPPAAALPSIKPAVITTDGTTLHGIGDPAAKVFICTSPTKPADPAPDCAATAAKFTGSPTPPTVTISPDTQQFAVTLSTALAANSYVYLEQIPAGGAAASAVFSQPVAVPAPAVAQTPIKPSIVTNPLVEDATTLEGKGDPTASVFICTSSTKPATPPPDCAATAAKFTGSPTPPAVAIDANTQLFTVTLATGLAPDSYVYLEQIPKGGAAADAVFSQVVPVSDLTATNEREQTDFVGGTLLSANGSNYSQASLFLALNYDRTIWRPGWYRAKDTACTGKSSTTLVPCPKTRHPGFNSFFQARLTTIPVNASTSTTSTTAPTSPAATSVSSFLASQKAAQFGGGIYMPILFGKVPSNKEKKATFYIAPIARFGFSTPSGSPSGNSSTATASGTTTTTTTTLGSATPASGQLYNYGLVGMRIATADLNPGAIHTTHYFDVGVGKYSNLQSLVCKAGPNACLNTTGPSPTVNVALENRTTLLRLEFEGFLQIISANNSSLILGISANTGPGFLDHRANLDVQNRAAEDIEFLIGYKFDVSQLLGGISIIGKNP